jgi:hypothetical protein
MSLVLQQQMTLIVVIIINGLGRLTCSGIDRLPSFPRASMNSYI